MKGVVAVLIDRNQKTVASASMFEQDKYSGISILETQKMRVRTFLAEEVAKVCCAAEYAEAIGERQKEKIMQRLVDDFGYRISIIEVDANTSK